MRLSSILATVLLMISPSATLFADAVLDVAKPEIVIDQKHQRDYIPLTNIGNETGTFTVQVKNITDPNNVITYSNKELKSLPVIISPILITNLGIGSNKRISIYRKEDVKTPVKLQLVISEYKKPTHDTSEIASNTAGIEVQGSIHYVANIELS